jgi:uncharacterized phage-associated protein
MYRDRKALEAASYLLQKLGGRTEYIKLIKLLYLSDRALLQKHGRTITGDRMYALPNGPILSRTLDRLKGEDDSWNQYLTNPSQYDVKLANAVPLAALSQADCVALDTVFDEHGNKSWEELVEYTHTLPEWKAKNIGGHRTRATIELADIGTALGLSKAQADALNEVEQERESIAAFWSSIGIAPTYV